MQADLYRELAGDDLLPWSPADVGTVLERVDRILDRLAKRYAADVVPALPRVWWDEIDGLRLDLRGWVQEAATEDPRWRPAFFELGFGLPAGQGRDPRSCIDPVTVLDRVELRGAIDLVEVDDAEGVLRVTDHKTGRPPSEEVLVVGGGKRLQPLLYALAAEEVLELPAVEGRLSFCTRRGGYRTLTVPLGPYQRHEITDALEIVDNAVTGGFLPAAPAEGACSYCDYRTVCGPYEEVRVERKQRRELAELDRLRSKL